MFMRWLEVKFLLTRADRAGTLTRLAAGALLALFVLVMLVYYSAKI